MSSMVIVLPVLDALGIYYSGSLATWLGRLYNSVLATLWNTCHRVVVLPYHHRQTGYVIHAILQVLQLHELSPLMSVASAVS